MGGPNAQRLVLITWTEVRNADTLPQSVNGLGTGYFVTPDLVLTAYHVVPKNEDTPIGVRVESGEPRWREGSKTVWSDRDLDAALIRVESPLPSAVAPVLWNESLPEDNATWNSTGYPEAARVIDPNDRRERKSAGLDGTLYVQGGGGQGQKELELGANNPPPMNDWAGASGAPVFVGDRLMGFIKSAGFDGKRFHGVPAGALLQNVAFRRAIEPAWLDLPSAGPWALVLLPETVTDDLVNTIKGSFERHEEAIAKTVGQPLHDRVVAARVSDAISAPGRWLQLVEALCVAPIMIADVTGFEPAVMLALGVRAVVRRGITIASTANSLDDTQLSALPFNIQESKLISHGDKDPNITDQDPRYSLNIITATVLSGFRELRSNPRYLDLPVYEAVRCPPPELPSEQQKARETVLVLCPFQKKYARNWHKVADVLAKHYPSRQALRMRDIVTPRLVGQALYEQIRWTRTCVVDWTDWRPNVFFEFGVRLACSEVEPVCLLEQSDSKPPLAQIDALIALFDPTRYTLSNVRMALQAGLRTHEVHKALRDADTAPPRELSRVPHNGTYIASVAAFEYAQERVTLRPHELLRKSVEELLGKDRQKSGDSPVLFGSNIAFARDLRRSVRERWIAAWYYLRSRYTDDELRRNALLRGELKQLGETLLQEVRDDPSDRSIAELRIAVIDLIDSLDVNEADSAET